MAPLLAVIFVVNLNILKANGMFTDAIEKQQESILKTDAGLDTVSQQSDDDACKEIFLNLRRGKYVSYCGIK